MLILGVYWIIRSLSRVLLGLFYFLWLGKILTGALCGCGVLDDIFFICIGFIRVCTG